MDIETVDSLTDRADELARLEPGSARALQAARDSVAAAQTLATSGVPGGRLRLARALWRMAAAESGGGLLAAQEDALHCWTVCRSLLDRPDPAEDQNYVVAQIAYWLGVLIPVLTMTRRPVEAAEAMERVYRAAGESTGPHALHANARLNHFVYTAKADEFAQAKMAGRYAEIADALDQMIDRATKTLEIFEAFATHGPYEAGEYAQAVRIASRLVTVAGDVPLAARMLDRAEAVSAAIAGYGPAFQSHAEDIRRERDDLTAYVPRQ